MKKLKITYGVPNMMEFHMQAPLGKGKVNVAFTEGSVSSRGVNPATYTTDNFLVQKAIENSNEFKRGLIKKIKVYELDEEIKVVRNPGIPVVESPVEPVPAEKQVSATTVSPTHVNVTTISDAPGFVENSEPQESTPNEGDKQLVRVEFSLNDDAKDYLEQQFGVVKSKLRNRPEIIACAKENGVDLIFV